MGCDEICGEVESEAPPDSPENVSGDLLHPPQGGHAVVDFGEVLEEKDEEEKSRRAFDLPVLEQPRGDRPDNHLKNNLVKLLRTQQSQTI